MSSLHEEESFKFLQLMTQYKLTEVSDTHLKKFSHSGCKQWKSLPPHLKLEAIVAVSPFMEGDGRIQCYLQTALLM